MSNKRYDVIAAVREYEKDGETKKVWINCGTLWEREKGGFSLTLDALPVKRNDNDQLSFLVVEPNERSRNSSQSGGGAGAGGDDIPF